MTKKNKINVLIDGRNFTIIGNSSKEYVYGLASDVDEKIKEMTDKNSKLSSSMAATLAAINIADELHKTREELDSLKSKSKGPMEKHHTLVSELKKSNEIVGKLEKDCERYRDELLANKKKNEELDKSHKNNIQALELKEKELKNSQEMIKKLQDKIFENQMELIDIKKELEEAIKTYDNEKNMFNREEV